MKSMTELAGGELCLPQRPMLVNTLINVQAMSHIEQHMLNAYDQ